MSTATDQHSENNTEHGAHEHGMSDAGYIKIALILAAITALEVSTYYVDFGPLFMPRSSSSCSKRRAATI